MADSDGVGLNRLQFTTRIAMSLGLTPVLAKSWSRAPNMTVSASLRALAMDGLGGMLSTASGRYMSSPSPERSTIRRWSPTLSSVKVPSFLVQSMKRMRLHRRSEMIKGWFGLPNVHPLLVRR
jgi:hypothetical protein